MASRSLLSRVFRPVDRVLQWAERGYGYYGFWLGLGGVALTTYFGINEDFPIFIVAAVALALGVNIFIAASLTKERRHFIALALLIALVCTGIVLWAVRVQHNREVRAYNNYYLGFAGFAEDAMQLPSPPGRPRIINRMRLAVTFDNDNDFPIYVKSIRRYVTINGQSSNDEQEAEVQKVPDHMPDFRVSDSFIKFTEPLVFTQEELPGTIDFTVCYGREKGNYTKSYNMKGKLSFPRWVDGLPHIPSFIPADLEDRTYGYAEGCPG